MLTWSREGVNEHGTPGADEEWEGDGGKGQSSECLILGYNTVPQWTWELGKSSLHTNTEMIHSPGYSFNVLAPYFLIY